MRRKDRQNNSPDFLNYVLDHASHIYVAFMDGEYPYCLPFNFAVIGNKIYIHCAREGKKLDLIHKNPHAAFSIAIDEEINTEEATTYYKSVCGKGLASIVEDSEEKRQALNVLGSRYKARCAQPATDRDVNRVDIIRLDIEEMNGKQNIKKT